MLREQRDSAVRVWGRNGEEVVVGQERNRDWYAGSGWPRGGKEGEGPEGHGELVLCREGGTGGGPSSDR